MKFNLSVLLDDATRNQIKKAILGIAKSIPRNEITDTLNKEIERLGQNLAKAPGDPRRWQLQSMIDTAVRTYLERHWTDVGTRIRETVVSVMAVALAGSNAGHDKKENQLRKLFDQAAEVILREKIKKYTLWHAEDQDAYVRKVVKSELGKILKAADANTSTT
jgi:hypothetical protein